MNHLLRLGSLEQKLVAANMHQESQAIRSIIYAAADQNQIKKMVERVKDTSTKPGIKKRLLSWLIRYIAPVTLAGLFGYTNLPAFKAFADGLLGIAADKVIEQKEEPQESPIESIVENTADQEQRWQEFFGDSVPTGAENTDLGPDELPAGNADAYDPGHNQNGGNAEEETLRIDPEVIAQIESSGDHRAIGDGGKAHGLHQFWRATWDEVVDRYFPDKGWTWKHDAFNPGISTKVCDAYYNKEIPRLLNAFDIPDSVETRIAAFNWGIGNLRKAYREHGDNWLQHAPTVTKKYVEKYNNH